MLKTAHETTESLCKGAKNILEGRTDSTLYAAPYQFQAPDSTQWWLARDGKRPTYRLVKFHFSRSSSGSSPWFAGIVAEKGLGPSCAEFCRTAKERNQVMDETWQWDSFLREMRGTDLNEALDLVLNATQVELRLECGDAYVPGQSYNPRAPRPRSDELVYRIHSGGRLEMWDHDLGLRKLNSLTSVSSLAKLSDTLSHIGQLEFHWIDLFLGANLYAAPKYDSDEEARGWDQALVDGLLMPLLPWVVADGK